MSRPYVYTLVLGFVVACGCGTGPTPTRTSVSVTSPPGTIFIGNVVQFEAEETLSDGTTRVATNVTWGSDAPNVATVSSTGLVTAVGAGRATIFAEVDPRVGTMPIRVFPNFGGSWAGNEVVANCEDSGALEGFCDEPEFAVGEVFTHVSMFSQTEASVDAVIVLGPATTASMTGNITVDGELQLPSAPVLPAEPLVNAEVQNWRSRADTPSRMTGTYEAFLTAPGSGGSVTLKLRLENVARTSATAAPLSSTDGNTFQQALRRISIRFRALR